MQNCSKVVNLEGLKNVLLLGFKSSQAICGNSPLQYDSRRFHFKTLTNILLEKNNTLVDFQPLNPGFSLFAEFLVSKEDCVVYKTAMKRRKLVQNEPHKLGIAQLSQYTKVGGSGQLEAGKGGRYM